MNQDKPSSGNDEELASLKVVAKLGIWDDISNTNLIGLIAKARYPRIEAVLATNLAPTNPTAKILTGLESAISAATFNAPVLGSEYPIANYFSYVKPVLDIVSGARSANPTIQERIERAQKKIEQLGSLETGAAAAIALFKSCDEELIKYGRLDQVLYFIKPDWGRSATGEWIIRIVLHSNAPQKKWVVPRGEDGRDEKGRWAYRCGQPLGMNGIHWISWPSSLMGLPGTRLYPVHVQGHALDNLYRLKARALFIRDGEWFVHEHLWQSLRNAKDLVPKSGGRKYLVPYYLAAHKLGYLVAERFSDFVLVCTFLFLTMDGTPEGKLLERKLKLTRFKKEDLELDKVHTFLFSDIQCDPDLVSILAECGCGDLFKIWKEPPPIRDLGSGYASQLRDYLESLKSDRYLR